MARKFITSSIVRGRLLSSSSRSKAMISKSSKGWVRSLFANSSSKKEAERRLAQIGLGMVLGLQNAEISLAHSQEDLFNIKNYLALRNQHSTRLLLSFTP